VGASTGFLGSLGFDFPLSLPGRTGTTDFGHDKVGLTTGIAGEFHLGEGIDKMIDSN